MGTEALRAIRLRLEACLELLDFLKRSLVMLG